jgi:hypothetical protein
MDHLAGFCGLLFLIHNNAYFALLLRINPGSLTLGRLTTTRHLTATKIAT